MLKEIKDVIAAGYLLAPPHPIETWENFKEQRVKGNSVFKLIFIGMCCAKELTIWMRAGIPQNDSPGVFPWL